jgi:hypothetical protein
MMETDDVPEALAAAAVGAAVTAVALNPNVRRAARRGAVWVLGRLLAAKDAAHAAVRDLARDAGASPGESAEVADAAEGVASAAAVAAPSAAS